MANVEPEILTINITDTGSVRSLPTRHISWHGSYRQVCVKFKDFSRTSKTFLLFPRTENL